MRRPRHFAFAAPLLLGALATLSACAHTPPRRTSTQTKQSEAEEHVKVELRSEPRSIIPGGSVELTAHFTIAPAWHIYAEDPGDAGLPTRVHFSAPPGYTFSELHYPEAQRFELPGPVVSFGYEAEANLRSVMMAPMVASGPRVEVHARVSWLACADACIPGTAELTLALPVTMPSH